MESRTLQRLKKEWNNMQKNPIENCSSWPTEDNIFLWKAQIYGPENTPYYGGIFNLNIRIPPEYPFKPPKINFVTKVYHPNINSTGIICLDMLKDKWLPSLNISSILLSICSLLSDPNPDDPLEAEIANEYINNRESFEQNAKSWTYIYAKDENY